MLGFGEAPLVGKGTTICLFTALSAAPYSGEKSSATSSRGPRRRLHTRSCPKSRTLCTDRTPHRVEWGGGSEATFPVQLTIAAQNGPAFSPKSPRHQRRGSNMFTISKPSIAPMRAIDPISKLLISASSKPSSQYQKNLRRFRLERVYQPAIDPDENDRGSQFAFCQISDTEISFPRRTFAPRKNLPLLKTYFRVGVSSGF